MAEDMEAGSSKKLLKIAIFIKNMLQSLVKHPVFSKEGH